jgi:hypothetical protein
MACMLLVPPTALNIDLNFMPRCRLNGGWGEVRKLDGTVIKQ